MVRERLNYFLELSETHQNSTHSNSYFLFFLIRQSGHVGDCLVYSVSLSHSVSSKSHQLFFLKTIQFLFLFSLFLFVVNPAVVSVVQFLALLRSSPL